MFRIKTLNKWANKHTYYPLDLIRFSLGIFLFIKGMEFVGSTQQFVDILKPLQELQGIGMIAIHYVVPAHLIGGILIFFGLYTRWAILAQLPIIIAAVLINFNGEMVISNLITSVVVLTLCVFFFAYGSGKHSADYFFKMET